MPLINRIGSAAAVLQEKTITGLIYSETEVTPDKDIDGLSKVVIAAQPIYEIKTSVKRNSESTLVISGLAREPVRVTGALFSTLHYSIDGIYEFVASKENGVWSCAAFCFYSGNNYNTVKDDLTITYDSTRKSLTLITRKNSIHGWMTTDDGYTVSVFY